jgi:tight adherence protein C
MDFYTLAVPILTFVAVMATGGALILLRTNRRRMVLDRLGPSDQAGPEMPDQPRPLALRPLYALGAAVSPSGVSARLREQLARAGHFERSAASVYLGLKMFLLLAGVVIAIFLFAPLHAPLALKGVAMFASGAVLFFVPNVILLLQRNARTVQVRQHLPEAVDLLEICVSAGMGLDMAWNAVTDEIRRVSPVLADEMLLANLEMRLGATRADSMRHMAQRTGADEIASLAALLVQAERFGTSIADALRIFAASMRDTRAQRAEEAAEKMTVKLLFPLVVFVFPTVIIVTAGPAFLSIMDTLVRNG